MKVRNGFVSNSSSSSFCILGAYINDIVTKDEFYELKCKLDNDLNQPFVVYDGYESAKVLGVDAETYLQDASITQARETVKELIKQQLPEKFHNLEIHFLHDEYEC